MPRRARQVTNHNLFELAEWNLAAKRLATKFMVVGSLSALLVPGGAALFRGTTEPNLWLVAGAPVVLIVLIAFGLRDFRNYTRSATDERRPPSSAAYIIAGQTAATLVALGAGEDPTFYRATLVVGIIMIALVGSLGEIVALWVVNQVLLLATTAAEGLTAADTFRLMVGFGLLWAVAAGVIYAVVSATFQVLIETRLLTEVAMVAANVEDLTASLESAVPLVGTYAGATAVTVTRLGPDGPAPVTAWPTPDAAAPPRCPMELVEAATAQDGVAVVDREAVMVLPDGPESSLAFHLSWPGTGGDSFKPDLYRAQLELMVVHLRSLVERARFLEALSTRSRTDPLTHLSNRHDLFDRLTELERHAGEILISIAMIDLDDFKRYNDGYGHLAGDELLAAFAQSLRQRARSTDVVARYGGEEFCVVLVGSDTDCARAWLDDVRARTARAGAPLDQITFSAGIAAWGAGEAVDEVLRRADDTLLATKAAGKAHSRVAGV